MPRRRWRAEGADLPLDLDLLELHHGLDPGETLPERFSRIHALVLAMALAATPDVAFA